MPKLAFYNARLITPEELVLDQVLLIQDGRIVDIISSTSVPDEYAPVDLQGCWLAPGFIDIHLHGGGGADTLDGSVAALRTIMDWHLRQGTTAFYPTLISSSAQQTISAIQAVKEAMELEEFAGRVLGVHLEGPFLNPLYCGAHDIDLLRIPAHALEEWQAYATEPTVKLITFAPELPGSEEFALACVAKGIKLSIGHSSAEYEQIRRAHHWGVNQCSHIFNAMQGMHHRDPGTAGSMLAMDRFYAQFIADGIHLHPAMLRVIARCKGGDKGVLISDAIGCSGMPDGEYSLGSRPVILKEGVARNLEGNLSGSTITLAGAVRNMVKLAGTGLQTAVQMATLTPAKAMGIENSKGSLHKGREADLVAMDEDLKIIQVWSRGTQIR